MASELPPTDFFSGITFNNSFYQSASDDYLTASTGKKIFLSYPVAQGSEIFPSNITLQSSLTDSTGSKGLNTQVLSSTGTGTQWIYAGSSAYASYTLSQLPLTLPTTTFTSLYIIFSGLTGSGGILTIPTTGFTAGTLLTIKNTAPGTLNISSSIILFTDSTASTSLLGISSTRSLSFFFNGVNWVQTTVSDKIKDLTVSGTLTAANISFNGAISTDQIIQANGGSPVELFYTTSTSPIYFGGGASIGPQHTTGPIIIGSDSTATGGINIGTGTDLTTPTVNTVNIGSATYGTNIKGSLGITGSTTVASGSNITLTSGNVTCTAGQLIAPTVRNASNTGSISSAGVLTGTSVVSATYGPAANATDVSFCATQTGTINIGTAQRTTASKFINIGNGAGSSNQINIGVSGVTTSIGGVLSTSVGVLAGRSASLEFETTALPRTLNSSSVNMDVVINFFGASTANIYTIANDFTTGQKITLKNASSGSLNIAFTTYNVALFGDITSGVSSTSIKTGETLAIQFTNSPTPNRWYEISSGSNFPQGLSSTTTNASTSVITPLLTNTAGLSIGTSGGATSVTIGGSSTPVNLTGLNKMGTFGTQFRHVLYGTQAGGSSGTGSVSFGVTLPSTPIVVATIISASTTQTFSVNVNPSTTGFSFSKTFIYTNLSSGGPATNEQFNWVAYCP